MQFNRKNSKFKENTLNICLFHNSIINHDGKICYPHFSTVLDYFPTKLRNMKLIIFASILGE